MIIALTGTPGTGKTSVSHVLRNQGYTVIDLYQISVTHDFIEGRDEKRDSKIVDVGNLDEFITTTYARKDLVLVEGHLAHLLKCVDKIIILRCHPKELRERLSKKGWSKEKIDENAEAELLDVILCEAVDIHPGENIFEIDTTNTSFHDVASLVQEIISAKRKNVKKFKIGKIDWISDS